MSFNTSLDHFHWYTGADLDIICPPRELIQQTPFRPYFSWPYFAGNVQNCWGYAECVFVRTEETRKQQWSATALVMGVLPITLFINVVWPRKRFVHVQRRIPLGVEVIVRALGLDVIESGGFALEKNGETRLWGLTASTSRRKSDSKPWAMFAVSLLVLLSTYAALAVVEIYSKRSSIGCVYPIFVLSWYIIAFVPALLHSLLRRYQLRGETTYTPVSPVEHTNSVQQSIGATALYDELEREHEAARDWWPIQLTWNIYYVIGILVYSSIMVVTVPELTVWVFASCLTVFASKICGFLLCALYRREGPRTKD